MKQNKLTLALWEAMDCKNPNAIKYHLTQVLTAFESILKERMENDDRRKYVRDAANLERSNLLLLLHEAKKEI